MGLERMRREAPTVASLIEAYLERDAKPKLRSWQDYQATLTRDVVPVLGDERAEGVTRSQIAALLDKVHARAPISANRVQNMLSSVFSWALSEGLVASNPVTGLRKRAVEIPKNRVLSDEEIRTFWTATAAVAPAYRDTLRLILLTGQRPGECAGIRFEEVDLEAGVWTLPTRRTKNKLEHTIPLVGEALEIIRTLVAQAQGGPLIITPRGRELSSQNLAKAMEALREGRFTLGVTPHDLRRTAATLLGRLEIDQMTIARVLNHASTTKATVTGAVYDRHSYLPQKRRALEALDAEVRRVVSGEVSASNVVRVARRS